MCAQFLTFNSHWKGEKERLERAIGLTPQGSALSKQRWVEKTRNRDWKKLEVWMKGVCSAQVGGKERLWR